MLVGVKKASQKPRSEIEVRSGPWSRIGQQLRDAKMVGTNQVDVALRAVAWRAKQRPKQAVQGE